MPRFSLLSDAALVTADVYRDEGKERYAAPSPSSSRSSESINTELTYSDDDDDVVDDEPLSYSIGRTRYALDTQQESLAQYQRRRWGYHVEDFDDIGRNDSQHLHVQKYPPVNDSYYLNADTAPTAALMRLSLVASAYYDDQKKDEEMDKLAHLLRASVLVEDDTQHLRDKRQHQRILALQEETSAKQRIQQEMRAVQMRLDEEHKQAVAALQMLLQSNDRAAAEIRSAEQKVQEEEQAEQERLAKEHQEWEKEEEAEQARLQERLVASIAEERKVEQEDQVHREAEQIKLKKEAAATEHVSKANKLRAQLIELEKSVQAFETSSIVSRRRLQMKKIVNGRVNTLAENVDKIGEVAAEVLAAISLARQEDAQAKEQPGATPDMSLGKRYILNLLSTKVIVRVQAEGFNGYVILFVKLFARVSI